jgi:fructose-1,6-bisphosphatase
VISLDSETARQNQKRSITSLSKKIALIQGQIETALKKFRPDLKLRLKKKSLMILRIQSHGIGPALAWARATAPYSPGWCETP